MVQQVNPASSHCQWDWAGGWSLTSYREGCVLIAALTLLALPYSFQRRAHSRHDTAPSTTNSTIASPETDWVCLTVKQYPLPILEGPFTPHSLFSCYYIAHCYHHHYRITHPRVAVSSLAVSYQVVDPHWEGTMAKHSMSDGNFGGSVQYHSHTITVVHRVVESQGRADEVISCSLMVLSLSPPTR